MRWPQRSGAGPGVMRWLLLIALTAGCRHARGVDIANTLMTAAFIAIEVSAEQPQPPPQTWCDDGDDPGNPPHICPGTAPPPPDP